MNGILGTCGYHCNECPFPYCVIAEAKYELKRNMAAIMLELGNTVHQIAETLDVTLRSVYRYRYTSEHVKSRCPQCNLVHSPSVMCKSNTYCVICENEQYVVILNKHRNATPVELTVVEFFIDYVFPSSIVERSTNGHDYWKLNKTEPEEAKNFQGMCDALLTYTTSLAEGRSINVC